MAEEKKEPREEPKEEVKPRRAVSKCPFCDNTMVEISRIGRNAYKRLWYDVTKKCVGCGFKATFEVKA